MKKVIFYILYVIGLFIVGWFTTGFLIWLALHS